MSRPQNPFETQYVRQEVKWYGCSEYDGGGVSFDMVQPVGRVDAYLNMEFQTGDYECPRLSIDGRTWMSLTKMEIESAWCPIQLAREGGTIATVGLGMGYFAMRAAQSPDVERVDCYEIDPRIIAFFHQHFAGRPGYRKVRIIEGDARETLRDREYDMVYADPYQTMLPDEVLTDIDLFCGRNTIGLYRFWGFERVVFEHVVEEQEWPLFDPVMRRFFAMWAQDGDRRGLARAQLDPEYREEAIAKMEDWGML
jgi:hypothetical protein